MSGGGEGVGGASGNSTAQQQQQQQQRQQQADEGVDFGPGRYKRGLGGGKGGIGGGGGGMGSSGAAPDMGQGGGQGGGGMMAPQSLIMRVKLWPSAHNNGGGRRGGGGVGGGGGGDGHPGRGAASQRGGGRVEGADTGDTVARTTILLFAAPVRIMVQVKTVERMGQFFLRQDVRYKEKGETCTHTQYWLFIGLFILSRMSTLHAPRFLSPQSRPDAHVICYFYPL
jgi:hypothetical protein